MRFYLFINGICSNPSHNHDWQDEAVRWISDHTDDRAEKYEYHAGPLTRRIGQGKRIRECAQIIEDHALYSGDEIVIVGHSNGCVIALEMLRNFPLLKIAALHLIAPAADSDCNDNGINEIVARDQVGKIYIYGSEIDDALKTATWTKRLFGWAGLGYGNLGLVGIVDPSSEAFSRIESKWMPYAHSEWFYPDNFNETMNRVTREG